MSSSGSVPVKAEDAGELVLDGGGVGEHAVGPGPAPVAGVAQDVLAEDLFFQGGAGAGVDVPGEAVVFGGVSGQLPGDDAARPGVMQDLADLGFDLRAWPAGLAAGEGGGQLVQLPARLGQGGAGEPAGLLFVQLGGVGEDRPALRALELAAGV